MSRAGVAVDVGGTKIVSASSNRPGSTRRWETTAAAGAEKVAAQIADAVRYWDVVPDERVVIASAGYLDTREGRILHASNLPFVEYPIAERVSGLVGCPVELIGDATAATVAELTHASRRRHRNGLYVTVSTGVGMGVVHDGRLDWLAGNGDRELGHQRVNPAADAEVCGCGRRGCLEAYGSGSSVVRKYLEAFRDGESNGLAPGAVTVTRVVEANEAGDARARAVIDEALHYLSRAIANAVREAEANIVVLGGGVMVHAGLFEPLRERVIREIGHELAVERSIFGEHSVIHGAAAICERDPDVVRVLGKEWTEGR
jgi:glucokinase